MKTKVKSMYQSPITSVIQLESSTTLLAGSVTGQIQNIGKRIVDDTW